MRSMARLRKIALAEERAEAQQRLEEFHSRCWPGFPTSRRRKPRRVDLHG